MSQSLPNPTLRPLYESLPSVVEDELVPRDEVDQGCETVTHHDLALRPIHSLSRSRFDEQVPYDHVCDLAMGGNGKCSLLQSRSNGAFVVCKIMKSWPEARKEIPIEAFVLEEILPRHERIIQCFGSITHPWQTQAYFEYCPMGDLSTYMQLSCSWEPEESFVWHCFKQLSEAIAFLHCGYDVKQGKCLPARDGRPGWEWVMHGDIKPDNILLRPSATGRFPDLVLADFGSAEIEAGRDIIGTAPWQPPEAPEFSAATDVWGAGAVIYAMCNHGWPPVEPAPEAVITDPIKLHYWYQQPATRVILSVQPDYSRSVDECLALALHWNHFERVTAFELMTAVHCMCGILDIEDVEDMEQMMTETLSAEQQECGIESQTYGDNDVVRNTPSSCDEMDEADD